MVFITVPTITANTIAANSHPRHVMPAGGAQNLR
jgi:hypothetical protein